MGLRYDPPTKRKAMTQPRAARIFVARDGMCAICDLPIYDGEPWEVEHPDQLSMGGSDDDSKLTVVHVRCHKTKTRADAGDRAKRNRIITASYAAKPKSKLSKEYRREVMRKYTKSQEATDEQ